MFSIMKESSSNLESQYNIPNFINGQLPRNYQLFIKYAKYDKITDVIMANILVIPKYYYNIHHIDQWLTASQ